MLAIGLMSGTSLDGVDAALVEIVDGKVYLKKIITLDYDNEFKKRLMKNLNDSTAKLSEICSLNFELGYWFVKAIDKLLVDTKLTYNDISFVASHGQTIWHNPKQKGELVPSTLQIGDGSVISVKTNITTVFNFRCADIVAGGEGAPLVPMSDYMLYKSDSENVILQNIGGMGNLTYLKKGCTIDDVIAFDTGPGNVMIDYFMKKYYDLPFDDCGKVANSGKVIDEVFAYLCEDEFLKRIPPKSTGRENYSADYMEKMSCEMCFEKYKKEDIITTITYYTAYSICYQYKNFIKEYDKVIVSGGGSHNKYILNTMKEMLKVSVCTQEDLGYSSDAKEAIAFAILGYLTLNKKAGNVRGATGAKEEVILGNIALGKSEKK